MANPVEIKDRLYNELDTLLSPIYQSGKIMLLGDFSARIGCDHHAWEGVMRRRHGVEIAVRMVSFTPNFSVTNTMFHLSKRNKTSWMHPSTKQ